MSVLRTLIVTVIITVTNSLYATTTFAQELFIYSSRHYDIDQQITKQFTDKTGIKINVLNSPTEFLLKKLEIEGTNTQADILITSDAIGIYRAKQLNLLQSVKLSNTTINTIPKYLQDSKNMVYPYTMRTRVIVYNKNKVNVNELSTYENLGTEKWKGKLVSRGSNSGYIYTFIAYLIEKHGDQKAEQILTNIVKNFAKEPKGGDRDQLRLLAQETAEVTIVNSYYVGLIQNSKTPSDKAIMDNLAVFFPNQGAKEGGTHVNISAAGVIKHSNKTEIAKAFIEFLLSKEIQEQIMNTNYEYPVNNTVVLNIYLKGFGEFKADTTSLEKISKEQDKAVKLLEKVQWR